MHGAALALIDAAAGQRDASDDVAASVLADYRAAHGKIVPGFGHRWHGVDPRAVRLLQLVAEAEQGGIVAGRIRTSCPGGRADPRGRKTLADPR